ncbi:G5 domain-containing protein [Candidatus Daviesbacteria bacterium]|nr:G5 domain-containing protein [Candidatus Daviesbacteria bacterium]MBI4038825.1 G5 domain-containing protein [Candidatus Daviesbacteria bacterium]
MERYLGIILIIILTAFAKSILQPPSVLGESTPSPTQTLPINQSITTQSSFTEKLQEETEVLPKKTIFEDDPETEAGEEKILDEGEDGKKVKIIKIIYSNDDEEYAREIVSLETIQPKDKKILRGTKIVWKNLDTPGGSIQYWKKMRVYATHYDSRCPGCNEWTATGMKAGKGVIAVDPSVIKLSSKIYIPGYGMAVAGDTGGAIKGNIIDLGFDDARTAGWSARFIDIYLIN